jgi:hypothetical protein
MWPAAFMRSRVVFTRVGRFTWMRGRLVRGIGSPSTRRRAPRDAIVIPPTRPASAAPPASAGPFALLAADPIAWPALCAPPVTVSRVLSRRSFTAPVALPAIERFARELRLLLEAPRAPLDDARPDCDRLLRDAARERELDEPERELEREPERGLALAPLLLEPLRLDAERPPEPLRLDELRLAVEPLLPDFELPWAILASLISGARGSVRRHVVLGERFADALDVVPEAVDVLAHLLAALADALADLADLLYDAMNIQPARLPS